MTTIAYSDGTLACDSASTVNGILAGSVRKIARAPNGTMVAACGDTITCGAVLRWVEGGMDGSPDVNDSNFSALIVRPDGTVCLLGGDGTEVQIDAPYHVLGSGANIALGALGMGGTAEQAVALACRWDGLSREPVRTMRLGE